MLISDEVILYVSFSILALMLFPFFSMILVKFRGEYDSLNSLHNDFAIGWELCISILYIIFRISFSSAPSLIIFNSSSLNFPVVNVPVLSKMIFLMSLQTLLHLVNQLEAIFQKTNLIASLYLEGKEPQRLLMNTKKGHLRRSLLTVIISQD